MSFTVLTAEFAHESNTFSRRPTDYVCFEERGLLHGAAAIAERGDANTPIAGFNDVARENGWRLIHAISASAFPSGRVTKDAYERIAGVIVETARQHKGGIQGVLLGLHGAMV